MYVIAWRFAVRPDAVADFERHYSPAGTWASFFRRTDGFIRTELLKSMNVPDEYMTIDYWESKDAYLDFRQRFGAEYALLDASFEGLTETEELMWTAA